MKRIIFVIMIIISIIGCSEESTNKVTKNTTKNNLSIEQTVKNIYEYANKSDLENLKNSFSKLYKNRFNTITLDNFIEQKTKNGNLQSIKVLYKKEDSRKGVVRVERSYKDGSKIKNTEKLVKEDGVWKLEPFDYSGNYDWYDILPEPNKSVLNGIWYNNSRVIFIRKDNNVYKVNNFNWDQESFIVKNGKIEGENSIGKSIYKKTSSLVDQDISGKWIYEQNYGKDKVKNVMTIFKKDNYYQIYIEKFYNSKLNGKNIFLAYYCDVNKKIYLTPIKDSTENWTIDDVKNLNLIDANYKWSDSKSLVLEKDTLTLIESGFPTVINYDENKKALEGLNKIE